MVEFKDHSIKAQLSVPDMHLPIQYALFYPERIANDSIPPVSFAGKQKLTFEAVTYADYPCLNLALAAAKKGGSYPAVLCAADEIAVDFFLNKKIRFTVIAEIIEETMNMHTPVSNPGLDDIIYSDNWARETALKIIRQAI